MQDMSVMAIGGIIVSMIVAHMLFKIAKLTIFILLFGVALIAIQLACRHYLGIDIAGFIGRHL